jgi:prevent-host-death family protein
MSTMTASDARAALPELLNRVEEGEEITITRHGRPVAVLVHPGLLRSRRAHAALADAEHVGELLAAGRRAALPTSGGLSAERADELIAEIRAGRAAR